MKKLLWLAGLAALCVVNAAPQAQAADYLQKAFDATFVTESPTGATTMHLVSDGKGHTMTETQAGRYHVISIFDYPGKVSLTINPEQKRIIRMALTDANNPADGLSDKPKNATPLGSKVIDGHPCKGWKFGSPASSEVEIWLADDIGLAVRTTYTSKVAGPRTTVLKSYAAVTPPASIFTAPSGYSVIEAPSSPPRF